MLTNWDRFCETCSCVCTCTSTMKNILICGKSTEYELKSQLISIRPNGVFVERHYWGIDATCRHCSELNKADGQFKEINFDLSSTLAAKYHRWRDQHSISHSIKSIEFWRVKHANKRARRINISFFFFFCCFFTSKQKSTRCIIFHVGAAVFLYTLALKVYFRLSRGLFVRF